MIDTEVNAKKEIYSGEDAWNLIAEASKVYVASGKKILEFDPASADKEDLLKRITGRSGNLRAPALKRGGVYYIGYNVDMYENLV